MNLCIGFKVNRATRTSLLSRLSGDTSELIFVVQKTVRMSELANEFSGASVLSSSSFDLKHPPASVIDGEYNTFWLTTGFFPQEIVIQLGEPSVIKGVEVVASGIRRIELSKCEGAQANMWESIVETEASDADNDVQKISLQAPPRVTAQFIRVKV
jgi:hypothetical protein